MTTTCMAAASAASSSSALVVQPATYPLPSAYAGMPNATCLQMTFATQAYGGWVYMDRQAPACPYNMGFTKLTADTSTGGLRFLGTCCVADIDTWGCYTKIQGTGAGSSFSLSCGPNEIMQSFHGYAFTVWCCPLLTDGPPSSFVPARSEVFPATQAAACVPRPSGVISSWFGEGNALDFHGINNGQVFGGTTFVPGVVGQAFRFDGVSGGFVSPRNSFPSGSEDRTLEGWFFVDAIPGGNNNPIIFFYGGYQYYCGMFNIYADIGSSQVVDSWWGSGAWSPLPIGGTTDTQNTLLYK